MTINNEKELKLFESTIESCTDPVWLVTSTGKQYDLKNPMEYMRRIRRSMQIAVKI